MTLKHLFTYITALFCILFLPALPAWAQDADTEDGPATEYVEADSVLLSDTTEDGYSTSATEIYREEAYSLSYTDSIDPVNPEARGISPANWAKLTADSAFRYQEPELAKVKEVKESVWYKIISAIIEFFTSTAGTIELWLIVALIVVSIIWYVVRQNGLTMFSRKNKMIKGQQTDELADDFIPESWEMIIQKAEQMPDYRLATRHSYRHILLLLDEQGLIPYRPSGSNYQYAAALNQSAGKEVYTLFLQLLRHYEYAWYGGFSVTEEQYQSVRGIYQQLKQQIV